MKPTATDRYFRVSPFVVRVCPCFFDGVVDLLDFAVFASRWSDRDKSVAIIVDSSTYAGAAGEIDRLGADIGHDLPQRTAWSVQPAR